MARQSTVNRGIVASSHGAALHLTGQGKHYSNAVNPVRFSVIEPDALIVSEDRDTLCNLCGVAVNGIALPDQTSITQWETMARSLVGYVHNGVGTFARFASLTYGKNKEEMQRYSAEKSGTVALHAGYLPLCAVDVLNVRNGKPIITRSVTVYTTAHAFFGRNGERLNVPNMDHIVARIPVGKSRADGTDYDSFASVNNDTLEFLLSALRVAAPLFHDVASMLTGLIPHVASVDGRNVVPVKPVVATLPVASPVPPVVNASLADEIARIVAFGLPTETQNAAIAAIVAKYTANGIPPVSPPIPAASFAIPAELTGSTDKPATVKPVKPAATPKQPAVTVVEDTRNVVSSNVINGTRITVFDNGDVEKTAETPTTVKRAALPNEVTRTEAIAAVNAGKIKTATPKLTALAVAKLTPMQNRAIALASEPKRKNRADNTIIAENLPDSWVGKNGETAQQRRDRAALQLI